MINDIELKKLKLEIKKAKSQGTFTHNIYLKNKINEIAKHSLNLIIEKLKQPKMKKVR